MAQRGVLRDRQPPAQTTTSTSVQTAVAPPAEIRQSLAAGTPHLQHATGRDPIVLQVPLHDPQASLTRLVAALADAGAAIDGAPSGRTIAP
jgi:hypothetical protein